MSEGNSCPRDGMATIPQSDAITASKSRAGSENRFRFKDNDTVLD
jgi:hypothetical protein